MFSCVFAEERIEFGLTAIKHRSVEFVSFCSDMHFQMLDLLLRRVPFQITPIQLNLPQDNFTRSLLISTSNMNAPEQNLNGPR